tara:strand:- start:788 stop:1111 length:324 start_codon:yes stop_codon:yes gene_type:complete
MGGMEVEMANGYRGIRETRTNGRNKAASVFARGVGSDPILGTRGKAAAIAALGGMAGKWTPAQKKTAAKSAADRAYKKAWERAKKEAEKRARSYVDAHVAMATRAGS